VIESNVLPKAPVLAAAVRRSSAHIGGPHAVHTDAVRRPRAVSLLALPGGTDWPCSRRFQRDVSWSARVATCSLSETASVAADGGKNRHARTYAGARHPPARRPIPEPNPKHVWSAAHPLFRLSTPTVYVSWLTLRCALCTLCSAAHHADPERERATQLEAESGAGQRRP
jgi:hypothetical protein